MKSVHFSPKKHFGVPFPPQNILFMRISHAYTLIFTQFNLAHGWHSSQNIYTKQWEYYNTPQTLRLSQNTRNIVFIVNVGYICRKPSIYPGAWMTFLTESQNDSFPPKTLTWRMDDKYIQKQYFHSFVPKKHSFYHPFPQK